MQSLSGTLPEGACYDIFLLAKDIEAASAVN
jgi:hypothetical protein